VEKLSTSINVSTDRKKPQVVTVLVLLLIKVCTFLVPPGEYLEDFVPVSNMNANRHLLIGIFVKLKTLIFLF
jgi:hypothetical protein